MRIFEEELKKMRDIEKSVKKIDRLTIHIEGGCTAITSCCILSCACVVCSVTGAGLSQGQYAGDLPISNNGLRYDQL